MRFPEEHEIQAKLWYAPEYRNLALLWASYTTHVFPRHWNETCVVQVVTHGVNEFYCHNATHTARPGSIVLINPYEIHTGSAQGNTPLVYRTFYPDGELLAGVAGQLAGRPCATPLFSSPLVWDPPLARLLVDAHRLCEQGTEKLTSQSLILAALSLLLRRHATPRLHPLSPQREPLAVRCAKEYLAEHFNRNISLDELARISHLSPFHLLRVFRNAVGLPPHEYLTNLRIERAKHLLKKGIAIAQVAFLTGFADQSHFHRQFKRLVGVTPGLYSKKSKIVQENLVLSR